MQLVRVALSVPLMQLFDYLIPEHIQCVIGGRVIVPFGTQKKVGIVVEFPTQTDIDAAQLKTVLQSLDSHTLFSESLWSLLHWAAAYYQGSLGDTLLQALPAKLRNGESIPKNYITYYKVTALGQKALENGTLNRAKKQLEALTSTCEMQVEKNNNVFSHTIWTQLLNKNFVCEQNESLPILSWQQKLGDTPLVNHTNRLVLNKQQALIMSQLLFHQGFTTWLLDGVTGSGKTEIYLQFIESILQKGQQILVLVPEIGLTPQTVHRFRSRFNVEIDVLHSNLNDTQRLQVWQRARSEQSAVIIGTRSALFTPFANLGLIIIDEEHDPSFKQQDSLRYHARDLAVVYAKQLNIPLIIGSATPSLESLNNVACGKYKLLELNSRANNEHQITQEVIDLKRQTIKSGLSVRLLQKMEQHLQQGNQVLLFLNRRGFAPVLLCHECGWIAECLDCEKPYTYHQKQRVLRCHHCGGQKPIPYQCQSCGSTNLITTGVGTEQLEHVLQAHFPHHQIARIDRDSTARKGALEQQLNDITQGKSQILIGTQMLAKGHHFPNVTLVGLINVDSALFSLDFRAEERLAQLYIQVAGRAGRAQKAGEVVLQTHYPDHPLLNTLLHKGYRAFAQQALQQREHTGLPPFSALALFKVQSRHNEEAQQFLQQLVNYFSALQIPELQLLGPIPAPFSKKAGLFRWHLLLKHPSKGMMQKILRQFQYDEPIKRGAIRWSLDVDPLDLS